ncbi:putative integral membrane protein [Cladorrhinum sp. PSN332]|nr:putative integral membrane protein [Cladorrhinum sp. PSN332]
MDNERLDQLKNEDQGPMVTAVCIAFMVLTTVFLCLRVWASRIRAAKFGVDDGLMFAAYIVNLGLCILVILMVKIAGVGQHVEVLMAEDPEALVNWQKSILGFEFVYLTAVAVPKLSILCLYLRVLNWNRGPWRWATFVLIGMVIVTWLALMIAVCFQCRPLRFWWDPSIPGGKCFQVSKFFDGSRVPSFVLDLFVMLLPLRTIWALKLSTAKKFALVLAFMVASFGIIASIIRSVVFFSTSPLHWMNRTWASAPLIAWSVVETGCYIIANSLSHLRPLVSRFTPQLLKDKVSSFTHGSSSLGAARPRVSVTPREEEDTNGLILNPYRGFVQPWQHDATFSPSQTDMSPPMQFDHARGQHGDYQFIVNGDVGSRSKENNHGIQILTEVRTEVAHHDSGRGPVKDAGSFV